MMMMFLWLRTVLHFPVMVSVSWIQLVQYSKVSQKVIID